MSRAVGVNLCSPHSTRLKVGILLMIGLFCATLMRICLSMAVVCMVNQTSEPNITYSAEIQISELTLNGKQNSLGWSNAEITLLLSATFYGGLLTAFWSGYLSDRFKPKLVILFGVAVADCVTALTPTLAKANFYALFFARIAMGLGEDFISPAQTSFINRWFSPVEMARIGSFTITGKALAGTVGFPVSSYLCRLQSLGGWEVMFYLFAIIGAIWLIAWAIYSADTPAFHRTISDEEKEYIQEELKQLEMNHDPTTSKLYEGTVPWKSIFTSKPIYINLICQFTFCFSEAILSAYLPMYIHQVLQVSMDQNGSVAMISFFAQLLFQVLFGYFTDMSHKKGFMDATTSCKLCQGLENFLCALAYLCLGFFVNKDTIFLACGLLALIGFSNAASVGGFMTVSEFESSVTFWLYAQPSLAPQYAGILASILRITAALGALAAIYLVGIINQNGTPKEWRIIWIAAGVLNIITGFIFLFFGEAETQDWAKNENSDEAELTSQTSSSFTISSKPIP